MLLPQAHWVAAPAARLPVPCACGPRHPPGTQATGGQAKRSGHSLLSQPHAQWAPLHAPGTSLREVRGMRGW